MSLSSSNVHFYICSYNEISRQLKDSYSKYVPNIKEAFIEHRYHYKSKYTWNDDYVIVDSLLELILIFEIDSITHLNKDSNWNINNFHGSMPYKNNINRYAAKLGSTGYGNIEFSY